MINLPDLIKWLSVLGIKTGKLSGSITASDTYANIVANYNMATYSGRIFKITDVGVNGGSLWYSDGTILRPYGTNRILVARNEYPTIEVPSGTIGTGTSNQLTLGTALPRTIPRFWGYLAATATTPAITAGLYYMEASSTTAVTIYSNGPGSAAINFTVGATYTSAATSSLRTAATFTIPANLLSTFGGFDFGGLWEGNNSANSKGAAVTFGGVAGVLSLNTSGGNITYPTGFLMGFRNMGSKTNQVVMTRFTESTWVATSTPTFQTVDTSVQQTVTIGVFKANAADYTILYSAEIWLVM